MEVYIPPYVFNAPNYENVCKPLRESLKAVRYPSYIFPETFAEAFAWPVVWLSGNLLPKFPNIRLGALNIGFGATGTLRNIALLYTTFFICRTIRWYRDDAHDRRLKIALDYKSVYPEKFEDYQCKTLKETFGVWTPIRQGGKMIKWTRTEDSNFARIPENEHYVPRTDHSQHL